MPPPLFILQNPARPRPWGTLPVIGALQEGDKNKMASFCCKHIIQANERLIKDPLESISDELLGSAQLQTGGCGASKRTECLLTLMQVSLAINEMQHGNSNLARGTGEPNIALLDLKNFFNLPPHCTQTHSCMFCL